MQDISKAMQETRTQLIDCVDAYKVVGRQLATAERDYKIALRQEILRLHMADGVAWTSCTELAHGEEKVADLRYKRDLRKSDYAVCYEKILQLKLELKILEGEAMAIRHGG